MRAYQVVYWPLIAGFVLVCGYFFSAATFTFKAPPQRPADALELLLLATEHALLVAEVAIACFLLHVFTRRVAVHANLRFICYNIWVNLAVLGLTKLTVSAHAISGFRVLPMAANMTLCFVHDTSVLFFSTHQPILALERTLSTFVVDYENKYYGIGFAALCSAAWIAAASLVACTYLYPLAARCIAASCLTLQVALFIQCQYLYRLNMNSYASELTRSLSRRYQVVENIRLLATLRWYQCASIIQIALCSVFVSFRPATNTSGYSQWILLWNLVYSVACLVYGLIFLFGLRSVRAVMSQLTKCVRPRPASNRAPLQVTSVTGKRLIPAGDHQHVCFEHLESTWRKP